MPAPPSLRFGTFSETAERLAERIVAGLMARPAGERLQRREDQPDIIVSSAALGREVARRAAAAIPGGMAGRQIYTMENFARSVLARARVHVRVASETERRLTMRAAVQSFDDPLFDTRGVVSMLERSYRDLRDSGWSVERLEKNARIRPLRSRERTLLVARIWRHYEKLIAAAGALDPADLLGRAAATIAHLPDLPLQTVAGFYDMTGVQFTLVAALHRSGKLDSVDVPLPQLVDSVDRGGRPGSQSDAERYSYGGRFVTRLTNELSFEPLLHVAPVETGQRPSFTATQHPTPDEELQAICRSVRRLLDDGVAASSIGIVSRAIDSHDAAALRRFAEELRFRVSDRTTRPLRGHRFGRALSLLLQLRDRDFARGDVIEILRCGFRTAASVKPDRLDQATRAVGIAGGTLETLRSGKRPERYAPEIEAYLAVLSELERITAVAKAAIAAPAWGDYLELLLTHFRCESTADLDAANEIDVLITTLRRLTALRQRFDTPAILDLLERSALPTEKGTELPVWYGDVMKARGRLFQHLFIMRMQDDLFPQRRVEDPLIPDSDRKSLGLPQVGDGKDEERLLFQLLLDSASTVHFTFSATDGFGKPLRPSPLLRQFLIEAMPQARREILHDLGVFLQSAHISADPADDRAGRLAGVDSRGRLPHEWSNESPAASLLLRQMQRALRAGTRSVFDGYLSSDPVVTARISTALGSLSPTQLEEFGECPQRFLLKAILGVREVADPADELQIGHREKGTIDHRILETFYRGLESSDIAEAAASFPLLPPVLAQRLDEAIDEAFRDFAEQNPAYNAVIRDLEKRMTRKNLRRFVVADLTDLRNKDLTPRWFEYRFGSRARSAGDHPDSFRLESAGVVLSVDGVIDRIDEGNGRLRIVDYKSGKGKKYEKLAGRVERGTRLQLALYAMAVREIFAADSPEVSAAIKPLTAGGKSDLFTFSLTEMQEAITGTLELFVRSIVGGVFPALPDSGRFGHCLYCPVGQSCRSRHDPAESYALAQYEDARALLEEITSG